MHIFCLNTPILITSYTIDILCLVYSNFCKVFVYVYTYINTSVLVTQWYNVNVLLRALNIIFISEIGIN